MTDTEKLTAGRGLDARVAKALGVDLPPTREHAMAKVGMSHVSWTGPVFRLDNGDDLPVPNGETLKSPAGTTNWNDRYGLYVAEYLGDAIAAEVDAYRLPPLYYSTDEGAALQALMKFGHWIMRSWDALPDRFTCTIGGSVSPVVQYRSPNLCLAICGAILMAAEPKP